ncbi:MAG: FAD-dependent oxidoreductase, partial [Acidobacteriota bacterium]|nr:FAD-dependent oxidoreductase [Acidobacteriota bacterium]
MIVVGAGIIGLSCAWRLSQKGRKVTVFDKGEAAREASWAAAGMLAPGGEFDSDSPAAQLALRSLKLYPDFVRELEEESGLAIDFRQCGALDLSPGEGTAEIGIRSTETAYRGRAARFYPDDALVDPRDVTRALLQACRKRGVGIREHEPVTRIAGDDSEGVLIAAGAWSSQLFPGLPESSPVRGHLVAWPLTPGRLGPILRERHTYLMQRSSGLLVAGSTTEHVGFDRGIDERAVAGIVTRARTLLPELPDEPPCLTWNGFRPAIAAEMPRIGRIAGTSVWTAYGHYRNGILMAPETARM